MASVSRTSLAGIAAPETVVEVPTLSLIEHDVTLRQIADAIAGEAQLAGQAPWLWRGFVFGTTGLATAALLLFLQKAPVRIQGFRPALLEDDAPSVLLVQRLPVEARTRLVRVDQLPRKAAVAALLERVGRRGRRCELGLGAPRLAEIGRWIAAVAAEPDQGPVLRLAGEDFDRQLEEVAAAVAAMRGLSVTLVEMAPRILARVASAVAQQLHPGSSCGLRCDRR